MLNVVAIGALIAAAAFPTTGHRTTSDEPPVQPPAGSVGIDLVSYNGSGCPPPGPPNPTPPLPSVELRAAADASAFDITFRANRARDGLGATPVEFRRTCVLAVSVRGPAGYAFTVVSGAYRGQVALPAGASATYLTSGSFQGQPSAPAPAAHTVAGPSNAQVSFPFIDDQGATVWSPCGGAAFYNVSTEVRADAGTSDTRRTTSSADLTTSGTFTLRWQRC